MSQEVDSSCASCLVPYNSKDRMPKILPCYHTYCKLCIQSYMYQNQSITCLSCSKETPAKSINSIPDNPYIKQSNQGRMRSISGNGEEVYYSDSEEDDSSPASSTKYKNGYNGAHVQGVKDMVMNTQKANVIQVRQLIELNQRKIRSSQSLRGARISKIKDTIDAMTDFKARLEEELKGLESETNQLKGCETKLNNNLNQLNKINLMDFELLKNLREDCLCIGNKLHQEIEKMHKSELEKAVRQSTVKIKFENTDHLLNQLNADDDTIYMKLSSSVKTDPSLVYLTTFTLGKIFSDKIASHSTPYKETIKTAQIEDMIVPPQLEDPTQYIQFVKSFESANTSPVSGRTAENNNSESNRSIISSDVSRSASPLDKDDWQVVGKDKKDPKKAPLSFSEMAKKPGNPQTVIKRVPFPEKTIAQTNRPHCYFKVQIDNEAPFRVVFEMRPDMAPKMVDNFIRLCKGLPDRRGYTGSKIFRAKADDHILGGDFENDDGTGGHSAYEEKYFLAEQCPLKDHKGAIRMKGLERTMDGRCKIGSQFMIWVGDLEYKEYRFTLVFGKVVEGFNQLLEVSRIKAVQKSPTSWVLRQTVTVVESGVL